MVSQLSSSYALTCDGTKHLFYSSNIVAADQSGDNQDSRRVQLEEDLLNVTSRLRYPMPALTCMSYGAAPQHKVVLISFIHVYAG